MSDQATCPRCARVLFSSQPLAGRRLRCPACGQEFQAPPAPPAKPPDIGLAPAGPQPTSLGRAWTAPGRAPFAPPAGPGQPVAAPAAGAGAGPFVPPVSPLRRWLYLGFVLALIPLGFSLLKPDEDVGQRLVQVVKDHPDIQKRLQEMEDSGKSVTREEVYEAILDPLPGRRLPGAFLAWDSTAHWLLALLAAAGLLTVMLLLFEKGQAGLVPLVCVGFFTATAGIIMLLAFQWVAAYTQGVWVRGHGVLTILFYIVKFIGFSYNAAEDPTNGFLLSFLGFTCGVGFCEELAKALPVVWHFRGKSFLARVGWPGSLGWREACVWGLVSGLGFGVAEGIIYSSRHYNGILGGDIYLVRFVSCASLHAIWCASVALIIWWRMDILKGDLSWVDWLWALVRVLSVPMILHGLYDTLLKKDMNAGALVVALVSFGALVALVEHARRLEPSREFEARLKAGGG